MDYKTVAKSKSSNVAIGAKTENKKNKKSLSNAQFQPTAGKKRGVYVEKKIQSSTDTQEVNDTEIKTKPPRRPRPGQKKFLASVLTILSKSTTGTQYPDIEEDIKEKARLTNTNDSEYKTLQKSSKFKKSKYRSRVLNDEMLKSEKEQLIFLQPKKDITLTPSNNSVKAKTASEFTKSIEENEPKQSTIRDILENTIYSGVAEGITKEVLKSKPKKEKKLRINDDPETIASEIAKRDDKNMYNFFVDLLETTISVYNVKTDYDISDVSKTAFELDKAVVEKLQIKNKNNPSHQNLNCAFKCERKNTIEKDTFDVKENFPTDTKPSVYRPFPTVKPKMKAKSYLNTKSITYTRKVKSAPKSISFDNNTKYIRKPSKKQIINDLKKQLAQDTAYTLNEPESLYDALKVMAKNKRRNEKSIYFNDKIHNRNNNLDFECMFERRKVISFGSRKNNKGKQKLPTSESRKSKNPEDFCKKIYPSRHSLEVYGYDYEQPANVAEGDRRIIFNYHSTPSISESNLGDYKSLIYTDSSASIGSGLNR